MKKIIIIIFITSIFLTFACENNEKTFFPITDSDEKLYLANSGNWYLYYVAIDEMTGNDTIWFSISEDDYLNDSHNFGFFRIIKSSWIGSRNSTVDDVYDAEYLPVIVKNPGFFNVVKISKNIIIIKETNFNIFGDESESIHIVYADKKSEYYLQGIFDGNQVEYDALIKMAKSIQIKK